MMIMIGPLASDDAIAEEGAAGKGHRHSSRGAFGRHHDLTGAHYVESFAVLRDIPLWVAERLPELAGCVVFPRLLLRVAVAA